MEVSGFQLRLNWQMYRASLDKLKPARGLFRNFHCCPHCEKNQRNPFIERINDSAPVISRSDGETFHLVLGDRPIEYPAEKSSGKSDMVTAGFWYVKDIDCKTEFAGTVVVMLRKGPGGTGLLRQLEIVADRLAEKINKTDVETFYEFDGDRLSSMR
jgi:hypothetical protein